MHMELSPGTYRIVVEAPAHEAEVVTFRVRSGREIERHVDLVRTSGGRSTDRGDAGGDSPASPAPPTTQRPSTDTGSDSSRRSVLPRSGRPTGTLEIELVHVGGYTMARTFDVTIDGQSAGKGQMRTGDISAEFVRSYAFRQEVPAGPHEVKVKLLGVRSDISDRPMQGSTWSVSVFVIPGKTGAVYHEWAGGIEDFARRHECCQRGHTAP